MGGSYNPIHLSHEQIAKNLSKQFDEIWFMPCYQSLWGKQNVDPQHRLNMCDLVSKKYPNIKTCSWEIDNKMNGGTNYIISEMKKYFLNYDLHFLIGQDNANNIHKFIDWEKLITNVKFVVVPRIGINATTDWFLKGEHLYIKDCIVEGISSSDFRNLFLKNYEEAKAYLNDDVYKYIIEHNLYAN